MYIAKKAFKAYMLGEVKEGQEVGFNKSWLDAGLIEEVESKPAKKEIETKPKKQKKETK